MSFPSFLLFSSFLKERKTFPSTVLGSRSRRRGSLRRCESPQGAGEEKTSNRGVQVEGDQKTKPEEANAFVGWTGYHD